MLGLEKKLAGIILQLEKHFNKKKLAMNNSISIIIPTLNEAANIGKLIQHLQVHQDERLIEIIVVDGGSSDKTIAIAADLGADIVLCTHCGRAHQMNKGSKYAKGDILYFIHSDTLPPDSYIADIQTAIQAGYSIGSYRSSFDSDISLLKLNSFFTRFDSLVCRGGDQTLFVTKRLFDELNGYKEELLIMEEYDFIIRAKKNNRFKIFPKAALISARKYENRGYFKVQLANFVVFNMFRFGASQEKLITTYRRLLG